VNIEEYISSGLLEAYALGELNQDERASVEANLSRYPELKEELDRIEKAQEDFLMQMAVKPRGEVREVIMEKIEQRESSVIPLQNGTEQSIFWRYAAAASIVLAITSSYLAYSYWNKWQQAENNLGELLARNEQIAKDYNAVNLRLDKIQQDLKITNNPDFQRIVMKGTENAPDAMAYIYWNKASREVYLSIENLKELSRENQYQLWAIVDGKPVDAGVFDSNITGLVKMNDLPAAAAFAVTVEPHGGKPSPTLETMQVIGNVTKG
jgi:anti-sigma-K factor RskA